MFPNSISLFFLLSAASFVALAENSTSTPLQQALASAEKHIVDFNATYNLPSLVVGLSIKGRTVWQKAYGSLELENFVPATLDTHYRLASISKTFTSGILGQLVDQGLVKYDDLLSKFLSEEIYPRKEWNITLRELLSHTAGTHVTAEKDFFPLLVAKNVTESIKAAKDEPLHFKPGTQFSYSNYGIQLIGAVIESVTKKSFQIVAGEFFAKLGLNSTLAETLDLIIPHRPRYYAMPSLQEPKGNVPVDLYDQLVSAMGDWPSGGIVSTVGDLLRWGNLMIGSAKGRKDGFLTPQTVAQMWTSQTSHLNLPVPEANYGLGWAITNRNLTLHPGLRHPNFRWHSGGLNGATTMLYVYPEEEVVGVALTNKGGGILLDKLVEEFVETLGTEELWK